MQLYTLESQHGRRALAKKEKGEEQRPRKIFCEVKFQLIDLSRNDEQSFGEYDQAS